MLITEVNEDLTINNNTIFRKALECILKNKFNLIGRNNQFVEIDEIVITKSKYNRGIW